MSTYLNGLRSVDHARRKFWNEEIVLLRRKFTCVLNWGSAVRKAQRYASLIVWVQTVIEKLDHNAFGSHSASKKYQVKGARTCNTVCDVKMPWSTCLSSNTYDTTPTSILLDHPVHAHYSYRGGTEEHPGAKPRSEFREWNLKSNVKEPLMTSLNDSIMRFCTVTY